MYLKERHINVPIQILKAILEDKNGLLNLKNFINDYNYLKATVPSYIIDDSIRKAIKKGKINKKIESLYSENKDFIKMIVDKDYYYKITSTLFSDTKELNWFLAELEKFDSKTLNNFVKKMEKLKFTEVFYTESNMKIRSYVSIQNSIFSEKIDFSTILTDGEVFFLGRYYDESYPYFLRNAKFVIEIHNNYGHNELYVNTFDVELPNLETYNKATTNIPNLNSQEIKNRTSYIRYLFELYKMQENLSYNRNNVYNCNKLIDIENKDLNSVLEMIDSQLSEVNKKIEEIEEKFPDYGYDKETFQTNMEYMKSCQRSFDLFD